MSKAFRLFHEPLPAYMQQIGMQWARYIEGGGDPPAPNPPSTDLPPGTPPKPADPPKVPELSADDIAALQAKVAGFEAAEQKRADEAKAKADAELTELQKAQRTIAELSLTNDRNAALAAHPVPAAYQSLVQGTDAASFLASAKLASELAAKAEGKAPTPDPIPNSGTGEQNSKVGSVQAGRDRYNQMHKKSS